ncbi:unnamed protein product [Acanthoscelides obtectus]|uniref:C2H2-type domain-containing protein n=1 Tax=Acanthoscelides obtectus TaxID=200917 RepID=A0A9P0PH65_ACAOB|nr:unnamed protein product [Acanthoscelides obtectus]CAK1676188.1 Zinc finger protein 425 [Acanthoscelides obtectus]
MKPKTDLKPDDELCIKSEEAYPDYVSDYDSVRDERCDGIDQAKMENRFVVKSEKPELKPNVNSIMFESVDTLMPNEGVDIKSEYHENALSDLTWHSIKIEEKLEPGIEADWSADSFGQMKMELQESEEKPHMSITHFENMDALGLNEEFDIKTESDQSDRVVSAYDSAQIRKKGKRKQKYSQIEKGKKMFSCYICNYMSHHKQDLIVHSKSNCHLGSSLKESRSASRKRYRINKFFCGKCNEVFKNKTVLDNHVVKRHIGFAASVSSKLHECTICNFKTVYKSHLTRHTLIHSSFSDLYICKHCKTSFKKKQSLFDHILKKHPDFRGTVSGKIYECMHCDFKKTSRTDFIKHMAKHNTKKTLRLEKHSEFALACTHCEYKTTHATELAEHLTKHTGDTLSCTKCDGSFLRKQSLYHHILQKHPEIAASVSSKIHECTRCEYKTTYSHYIASHMMKHSGAKYPCMKCNSSFLSKHSLDNHILQRHPEITASVTHKIHECTHCEYKTTRARDLAGHNMKHTGVRYTCATCDASFTTKLWLDNHILQRHPECTASGSRKIHECTHCEYKSLQKKQLSIHMMKHAATKLTCPKCVASFTTKLWLDNHLLQKHPECTDSVSHKICECTHCEYKTTFAHCLAAHITKHTGAKLTCTKCDASFAFKQSLGDHILQKHPELTASVSSKVHECKHCQYKTTQKSKFTDHARKHIQP